MGKVAQAKKEAKISIKNLTKSFEDGKQVVLRDITHEFSTGQLTFILGPSGAGKSVLLKHFLGLLKPDRGHVYVEGQDVTKLRGRELTQTRMQFGMLFQNSALFDDMSVFENVAFPLREHTDLAEAKIAEKVKDTLALLGMSSGWEKFPNELSGGMRKRVGLARAIIREPSILLYDEPTTGLDPVTRETVDDLIDRLKSELHLTSIVISHDIPSALSLADHIVFLHDGKFIFSGPPDEFRQSKLESIQAFMNAELHSLKALR